MQYAPSNLTGKLLLAMPTMGDPRFEQSVIFICSHSDEGAMGLIINKPSEQVKFAELLKQLDLEPEPSARHTPVYFGGPVEMGRGFVLHSKAYAANETTIMVGTDFGMTATLDVVEDLAKGDGPEVSLLALGYAGWGPGQLEDEIMANGWLTCDADLNLVFDEADSAKWTKALNKLGIDPLLLSSTAGRA